MTVKEISTEDVIKEMLTENTGRHFLDSGGAYGRHWEMNQDRDFDSEPASTVRFEDGWIDVTHNVYHFLVECLEFAPEMQERFEEYCKQNDTDGDKGWLELVEGFIESNEYAEEWGENTANGEGFLSQVIQYTTFRDGDGEEFCLLQIHGGCDIRGGYTAPKAFRIFDDWPCLVDHEKATIFCPNDHYWDFDGRYFNYGDNTRQRLEEYEMELVDKPPETKAVTQADLFDGESTVCQGSGKLLYTEDGKGYCPICNGELDVTY